MRTVLLLSILGCGDGVSSTVHCGTGATMSFPTFDSSCQADSDCLAVTHVTSCCGSVAAVVINISQKSAFDSAEKTCDMQYPGCGCAAQPGIEIGNNLYVKSLDDLDLTCVNGACEAQAKASACGGCPQGMDCGCCPIAASQSCGCSSFCSTNQDCTDPARPQCYQNHCYPANVACGTR